MIILLIRVLVLETVLGYQRQLPWAEAFNHAAQLEEVSGINYYEYEKNFVRLKFGVNFK